MARASYPLLVLATLGLGGCSLVVDFDRSLLSDGGTDAGIDAGVDAGDDAAEEGGTDQAVDRGARGD